MSLATEMKLADVWQGVAPSWELRDKNGLLVRLEAFTDEHQAQAYISGWNDCATFTQMPMIHSFNAPDGRRWRVQI